MSTDLSPTIKLQVESHACFCLIRKGDCIITAPDDALNVVVDLGVDHVKGGYFIEVKFGVFEAASNLKVEIESVQMIIKVQWQ